MPRDRYRSACALLIELCGGAASGPALAATVDVAPVASWSGDFGLDVALAGPASAFVETSTPSAERAMSSASTSTPTP